MADKSYNDMNKKQRELGLAFREASTDTMNAFINLSKTTMADGALSTKTKELMAVSIGIVLRCDNCIAAHVRAALKAGASREELVESINVAIVMGGGPALTYGIQALEAVDELAAL
ncbi:carboxymuconolactone decarboxylase family protein [Vibrio sp. HA2012]|uniref:carboxymuconolactone decarboxylase family protein n=1 Tax=Vibrio sp. HA2012 TaxID=1971595 RepID=UPI000C2C3036|nr:carboxymuconolactone decarboxylase family protein [Vibrio sp. HA2012]PJC88004.1 carboxymuconolactone decarboxylase family protein [Vibrio sp. HA2012]